MRTLCGFTPLTPHLHPTPGGVPPPSRGGSPEYYGCYTPISGRFRRDPRLQVFFSFEEMPVPFCRNEDFDVISRNLPESRKKDKNSEVSIDGLKKSRAGKQQRFFIKKRLCFWRERVRRTFTGESALSQCSQHNRNSQN